MAQSTLQTNWINRPMRTLLAQLLTAFTALNSMLTELFTDNVITVEIDLHATKTAYNIFYERRGYTVTGIDWVGDIAQAITGTVVKATGTAAPASGTTPLHTANGVNLNTAANTVQAITLTGNTVLAAGDRLGFVLNAALTTGSGLLQIRMTKS